MMNIKKSTQTLLVFMFFAGLSPVVTSASEPTNSVNQIKKHACSWPGCIKSFNNKSHLRRHKQIHTRDKVVHCTICNRVFLRTDNLKRHVRRKHSQVNSGAAQKLDLDTIAQQLVALSSSVEPEPTSSPIVHTQPTEVRLRCNEYAPYMQWLRAKLESSKTSAD